MDIEVSGASPVGERPGPFARLRGRGLAAVLLAAALGAAVGFSVADARADAPAGPRAVVLASPAAQAPSPGLPAQLKQRMVERVREYNKTEPATVEVGDVRLMTVLRDNLSRLDSPFSYPRGDYKLQVICLGEGQVWALFRIGIDETYVDMDCREDRVLVTQLLLTARADGPRAVTLVSDSEAGLAVAFQVLRSGA